MSNIRTKSFSIDSNKLKVNKETVLNQKFRRIVFE